MPYDIDAFTDPATLISSIGFTLNGHYTIDPPGQPFEGVGFEYYDEDDNYHKDALGTVGNPYHKDYGVDSPDTIYRFRFWMFSSTYLTDGSGWYFGEWLYLRTGTPLVITKPATATGNTIATLNGEIIIGDEENTERGFCWKEGEGGEENEEVDGDTGGGEFSKELIGLEQGKTYYFRAYGKFTASGTIYGEWLIFGFVVTTQAVSNIGDVTAIGNGNIILINDDIPTKRGICWNTTGAPTVADSKTEETGEFSVGAFTETLINLSPDVTYYVRAYAMNAGGYAYGEEVEFTTHVVDFIGYSEPDMGSADSDGWVKFITAAPGSPGDKPTGYKNDVCSDYSGYTYILNRSLTDDGATYESYFVLSTDLSGKKTLHTNKRLEDIFSYFANKGTGTAKIYVKRDTEPAWQYAGEISLAGEEEIIIKHLPSENEDSEGDVDFLAKTFLIKFVFENDFEFIGAIFEAIPIGDRP